MKYHVKIKESLLKDENGNIDANKRHEVTQKILDFLTESDYPHTAIFSQNDDIEIIPLVNVRKRNSLRPRFSTYRHDNRRR